MQRSYQKHRDNQLERILEAAEALFIRNGVERVSVNAIAQKARLSRKTVYQYFPDKEEIAWALFQRIFEQWSAVSQTLPIVGNGYQKLEFLVMQNIENFEANRHHLRFIVEFDALYARQAGAERVRRILEGIKIGSKEWVAQTIRQGIADGSIRPDVEPELTASGCNGRRRRQRRHKGRRGRCERRDERLRRGQ
ncbi:MAG: TetR/AcrR family transcriptional regulator [Caldilinea sp.]|nr:TetR/AcrR family transcriptional regulator [Caldilinea sp.]MDW8440989.1 TetR/AcrR family transcriptional regulator [Caldilineaceae bacterium]